MDKKILPYLKNLSRFKNILILSHFYPDPDAIASSLLARELWRQLAPKSKITIANEGPLPDPLKHLAQTISGTTDPQIKVKPLKEILQNSTYDAIVLLDNNELENFTRAPRSTLKKLKESQVIIIDHHPENKRLPFAPTLYIREKATSTAEVLGHLYLQANLKITPTAANAVLTGIISDTNRLLYTEKLTSATFNLLAQFYSHTTITPLQIYKIISNLTLRKSHLLGYFFSELRQISFPLGDKTFLLTYIFLDNSHISNLLKKGFEKRWIEGTFHFFINTHLVLIHPGEIAVAGLYEQNQKKWIVSLRSTVINVRRVAEYFGGTGHPQASVFTTTLRNPRDILKTIVDRLPNSLFS